MNGVLTAEQIGRLAGKLAEGGEKMITNGMAIGSNLGIDATKKLPVEGFKRAWPPWIKMDEAVKAKVEDFFKHK